MLLGSDGWGDGSLVGEGLEKSLRGLSRPNTESTTDVFWLEEGGLTCASVTIAEEASVTVW